MTTKHLLLALLVIIFLNQLGEIAKACEITPADWAEVEEEIGNE
jgi:hypothetical protein